MPAAGTTIPRGGGCRCELSKESRRIRSRVSRARPPSRLRSATSHRAPSAIYKRGVARTRSISTSSSAPTVPRLRPSPPLTQSWPDSACEVREQRARGASAVRVLRLPFVAQLRDCPLLAVRDEDRGVAEALAPHRGERDASLECARAAQLGAIGREEDELRDVARGAVIHIVELRQQLHDGGCALRRVACRQHAGPTAERLHLEPRVLGQHPAARVLAPEHGLDPRVLVVRLSPLGWVVVAVERLDRPAREEPLELPCLVPVAGAESCLHSIQRTSSTPSISATPATIRGAAPAGSSMSAATERRSPSCVTS